VSGPTSIIEVEDALARAPKFTVDAILDSTAEALGNEKKLAEGTNIMITATITRKGQSSGVVKVGDFSVGDLYAFAEGPAVNLGKEISRLIDTIELKLLRENEPIARELLNVQFWTDVLMLKGFFGIGAVHDEFVSVMLTIAKTESALPCDANKMDALLKALAPLANTFVYTDDLIDEMEDVLEEAGFDLNAPLAINGNIK